MKKYWKIFTDSGWDRYMIAPQGKWTDSILEHILVDNPDFSDLVALTSQIDRKTINFIKDVEGFITKSAIWHSAVDLSVNTAFLSGSVCKHLSETWVIPPVKTRTSTIMQLPNPGSQWSASIEQ
jgi:hypothetical protein